MTSFEKKCFKFTFRKAAHNGLNTLEHIYAQDKPRRRAYFKAIKGE